MYNGIINIYKEKGFTSHDVVAKLRGILRMKKIGHTGTLDPDATGVLPVCLGSATKVCDMLTNKDKVYETTFVLGFETDTQDISGEVIATYDIDTTKEAIEKAVMSFVGEYDQIPPMYSALKVNGKKLYELAREGIEVERKARRITIHNIDIKDINMEKHEITMCVACSKGTYIRTLCYDIGKKLGCGGCLKELKRTKVSVFDISEAVTLDEVRKMADNNRIEEKILPVDSVFKQYDAIHLTERQNKAIMNGNKIPFDEVKKYIEKSECSDMYRIYDENGIFLAVYECIQENRLMLKPVKMFLEK
ncbi:MAG: tRNA pseudouridine(55) synthase TruB [Lachnospiraceae bacterium]|nr:tRNA pseudouridine(55) synthase TruB [Lachnospiraceae bacterium]